MQVSFGKFVLLVIAAVGVAAGGVLVARGRTAQTHFADADNGALVATGEKIYAARCAQCHGAHREGQANWQTVGADGRVRAPPQDETGHSWMHSDEQLFRSVKFSMADIAAPGYVSPMPAFDGQLSDGEIAAVLAYIKHSWPIGVRVYQAMLNPGLAGLPAAAVGADWHLPADCGLEPNSRPAAPLSTEIKP